NAPGLIGVNASSPTGPVSVDDIETALFAVGKQYRSDNSLGPAFVMNDTSYRRFRGIPVGPSDERRAFGSMYFGTWARPAYSLYGFPGRIPNDLPNNKMSFACLKKAYRMWRRTGFEVRFSDVGRTLMLSNTALLIVRGRFAGKVIDPNAASLMVDLQP